MCTFPSDLWNTFIVHEVILTPASVSGSEDGGTSLQRNLAALSHMKSMTPQDPKICFKKMLTHFDKGTPTKVFIVCKDIYESFILVAEDWKQSRCPPWKKGEVILDRIGTSEHSPPQARRYR